MTGKESKNDTAQVLIPLPLAEPFDYRIPEGMSLSPGDYVRVPFGRRKQMTGVVWSCDPPSIDEKRLKDVTSRPAVPPMEKSLREFIDWVGAYTVSPKGAVLKLSLTADSAQEESASHYYQRAQHPPAKLKLTPQRQRVLEVAELPQTPVDLARAAGCSAAVVQGLVKAKALVRVTVKESPPPQPDVSVKGPTLSPRQAEAAEALVKEVESGKFSVTLLEGVTGSGKTEVFATAIRKALAEGKQVLALMPEISLSVQMLVRLEKLFGATPVQWHSDLTQSARRKAWRAVASGTAKLVIGARSSLFLPFSNLGLIVVDEEHDQAYKQEEGVSYHARDMAIVRAQRLSIPVILSSATPSIESVVNVREGRYLHVQLPERHGGASLPRIELVDLLKDKPPRGRWLAPPVVKALEENLAKGEQSLLFLNRRGYAPLTLCRNCGHRFVCPNCTAWLVEHRMGRHQSQLQCHHCGHEEKLPNHCPHCNEEGSFAACGPGVERIEEETRALFPNARILVLASDNTSNWQALQAMLNDIAAQKVDIIIGTQIIAKGHHYPHLTMVAVVDADLGLEGGDMRARERTYQLLEQVSGRAGRAERPGTVFLQTQFTKNFIFQALAQHNREGFIAREIEERETYHWPPFSRLAALIVSGKDLARVERAAREIRGISAFPEGVEVFGPAPAPLARVKREHRFRLLIRAKRSVKLQPLLGTLLARLTLPKGVDLQIVIDPFTFL